MSEQLKQHRDQIDAIDEQLLTLVNERAKLARAIGSLKDDGVIYRPEREAQVLRRLQEHNAGPLSNEAVSHIFRGVMSNCRALEKKLSVSFLGPIGTFSHEAVLNQFGPSVEFRPSGSIDAVFRSVESGDSDYGVVPVENSTEGAVSFTLDRLVTTNLRICGEITLPVHHCLLVKKRGKLSTDVKQIYAHPQTFGQCTKWLIQNVKHAELIDTSSNSRAAEIVSLARNTVKSGIFAAVASKHAAEIFGLEIWAANIEDSPNNTTRFLIVGTQNVAPSGKDKTSLVLSTRNKPGAMVELLEPFARHGVSMTKFESRPSKQDLWDYVFFVDIEGHIADSRVQAALMDLQLRASSLKVLGSYPAALI